MVISAYQVNNVLRVYKNQLRHGMVSSRDKSGPRQSPDRVSISAGARRKAIIDKVAADVVEKITHYGPGGNLEREISLVSGSYGDHGRRSGAGPTDMVFKVIDEKGESMNALSAREALFREHKSGA